MIYMIIQFADTQHMCIQHSFFYIHSIHKAFMFLLMVKVFNESRLQQWK